METRMFLVSLALLSATAHGPKPGMVTAGQMDLIASEAKEKAAAHTAHLRHEAHLRHAAKALRMPQKPVTEDPTETIEVSAPVREVSAPAASGYAACVIAHESGGNAQAEGPGGYYGLYQFDESTWVSGGGNPADYGHASAAEQTQVFNSVHSSRGSEPWETDGC